MTRLARITELSTKTTRTAAETAELQQLARAELAAQATPPYPVGLVAKFSKREATITNARRDTVRGWSFTVDLKAGEFLGLGDGTYELTEAELRQHLIDELGAMRTGQLYPKGITVSRNNVGGTVTAVALGGDGGFTYALAGWPRAVSQDELRAILAR